MCKLVKEMGVCVTQFYFLVFVKINNQKKENTKKQLTIFFLETHYNQAKNNLKKKKYSTCFSIVKNVFLTFVFWD